MLKLYMNKLLFISLIFIATLLSAKEPMLGILKSVPSSYLQKFTIANMNYYCKAYAVLSVDELTQRDNLNATCKKTLSSFFLRQPQTKYFSQELLHVMQTYHLEFKDKECLLFAQGEVTLSELLLREGLAVLVPNFQDEEYKGLFTRAQRNARFERKGIWSEGVARDCIAEIYKK